MPNRIIRDSGKTSPTLAKLSDSAERLFYRLTVEADDFGRFEADPRVVQGACVPLLGWPLVKVRTCLQRLASAGLVRLYRVNGRDYGEFLTFARHQGKPRATKSKYPDPPDPVDCTHLRTSADTCEQIPANVLVSESVSESENRESKSSLALPSSGSAARGRRVVATEWPEGFDLAAAMPEDPQGAAWQRFGINPHVEFAKFRDHALTHGRRCKNWAAAWRNWARKAIELREARA